MTTDTDDTSNIRIYGIVVVFRLEPCRGFDIRATACMLEYKTATRKTVNRWEGLRHKVSVASSHNQDTGLGNMYSRERFLLVPRCHLTACELDRF